MFWSTNEPEKLIKGYNKYGDKVSYSFYYGIVVYTTVEVDTSRGYKIIEWEIKEDIMDNFKFKVGDIVTGTKENQWIYKRKSEITKAYKNENGRNSYEVEDSISEWYEEELTLVENKDEVKLEKSFREVIADIKEGEVWENKYTEIYIEDCKIEFKSKTGFNENVIAFLPEEGGQYTLQREQYTFEEALKLSKQGKTIESCVSGKAKSSNYEYETFTLAEIEGAWYINN